MPDGPIVEVRPVRGAGDLDAFIDLPYRLYAADSAWVPPFKRDVRALLDRKVEPFFDYGEAEYFLAWTGGRAVGRVAAISSRAHNREHGDKVGFFGFFECIDDGAVAQALLAAAGDWCRGRGHDVLRGPASFSVNHECGLLVENFTDPPAIMMPYNPAYYARLIESAGFATARDLLAYQEGDDRVPAPPIPERLTRAVDLIKKRQGITIRSLDIRNFQAEVESLKRLYNASWEKNWGFVPMTDREIDHMAKQFRPVVVPELVPFAERDGELIGFGLALPDLNVALSGNRSGRLLPAALKLLWMSKRRQFKRMRILLLGILPQDRGKGIDALLYHWMWEKGMALGIRWAEAGWILEENAAMNAGLEKIGFKVYRRYRLYDRSLV